MNSPRQPSAAPSVPRGFLVFVGVTLATVIVFAVPPLRDLAALVVTLPARLFGWIAPGATPFEDARIAGAILGWIGWATTPLLALPLITGGVALIRRDFAQPLVQPTKILADGADRVCGAIGFVASWLSVALVAIVAVVVAQRYVFGISFTKLQELILYSHAGLFLLVAAATLKADGHVRVDVLYSQLSPRGRAIINLIGAYLLLGVTCVVLLRASGHYVSASWRVTEGSPQADGLELVYLLKTLIPVFAVLMLAQGASLAARAVLILMGEAEGDPAPSHHEGV